MFLSLSHFQWSVDTRDATRRSLRRSLRRGVLLMCTAPPKGLVLLHVRHVVPVTTVATVLFALLLQIMKESVELLLVLENFGHRLHVVRLRVLLAHDGVEPELLQLVKVSALLDLLRETAAKLLFVRVVVCLLDARVHSVCSSAIASFLPSPHTTPSNRSTFPRSRALSASLSALCLCGKRRGFMY